MTVSTRLWLAYLGGVLFLNAAIILFDLYWPIDWFPAG